MKTSAQLFSQKYGYEIYKGNKSLVQLIGQANSLQSGHAARINMFSNY